MPTIRMNFQASDSCKRLSFNIYQALWNMFVPMPALVLLSLETSAWIFFSFPLNALDHSSYICLQHYLLSLLTHWDLQLGCRVYIIIMVGKTLSAAMSTAENPWKLSAWLNTSRSLSFVPLGIVQGFAVLKQHRAVGNLPHTLSHMCPMVDNVILRPLPLPGPGRGVPFIPHIIGTRMSVPTSLVHPGYEN